MSSNATPSERFVAQLCNRSFLALWTHPSPIGKNGKELCDCLVVCGDHLIIISVKDVGFRDTGDTVGWARWHKAAIDKSAKQIWGAERWLTRADALLRKDGRTIELPPKDVRKIHRISIALGGRGEVPLRFGDYGHGFVHLFDETGLPAIFQELDTISDFVSFLDACEQLFAAGPRIAFAGSGIEDLLALFVIHGRTFGLTESKSALTIIDSGVWSELRKSPEYKARIANRRVSFAWDRLIDLLADDLLADGIVDFHSNLVTKNELALVAMAMQPRGHRANLADGFLTFLRPEGEGLAARVVFAANATAFVFVAGTSSDRTFRTQQLGLRCFVVRWSCPQLTTVVGIATDRPTPDKTGYSCDIFYMHEPEWNQTDAEKAKHIQDDLGFFRNTVWPQ